MGEGEETPMTRREWLTGIAAAAMAAPPDFERTDTHAHIHRVAPNLLAAMEKAGWRALSICDCRVIADEPSGLAEMTRGTIDACRGSKGRLAWAATFDPRGFESRDFSARTIAELSQCFDQGAIGVKIWKNIGMGIRSKSGEYLMPDNAAFTSIFEAIQRAGKTLLTHLADLNVAWKPLDPGDPDSGYYKSHPEWLIYGRPGAPSKEAILTARDRILMRHPKLRVIGCHFGSSEEDLGQVAKRLDAFPNYAVDVASRVRFLVREDTRKVRQFMLEYADRVLYATDFRLDAGNEEAAAKSFVASHELEWSYFSSDGVLDYRGRQVQGLALPQNVLRKIFRANAERWLPGIQRTA
jgi:predicted TIM-barrel fold metal-dependent hydrolase